MFEIYYCKSLVIWKVAYRSSESVNKCIVCLTSVVASSRWKCFFFFYWIFGTLLIFILSSQPSYLVCPLRQLLTIFRFSWQIDSWLISLGLVIWFKVDQMVQKHWFSTTDKWEKKRKNKEKKEKWNRNHVSRQSVHMKSRVGQSKFIWLICWWNFEKLLVFMLNYHPTNEKCSFKLISFL